MKKVFYRRKVEPDDPSAKPEAGTNAPHGSMPKASTKAPNGSTPEAGTTITDKSTTKVCMLLFLLPHHYHHSLQIPGFLKPYDVFRITTKVSYTLRAIEYPWCLGWCQGVMSWHAATASHGHGCSVTDARSRRKIPVFSVSSATSMVLMTLSKLRTQLGSY